MFAVEVAKLCWCYEKNIQRNGSNRIGGFVPVLPIRGSDIVVCIPGNGELGAGNGRVWKKEGWMGVGWQAVPVVCDYL